MVTGDEAEAEQACAQATQALAAARGIPLDQATQQVEQMEEQYHQSMDGAKQMAAEGADTVASIVSTGALLAFAALVLGALAGWFRRPVGRCPSVYADRMIPSRRTAR